jgi:hypothetical protein
MSRQTKPFKKEQESTALIKEEKDARRFAAYIHLDEKS